jgi:L-asparaginase II
VSEVDTRPLRSPDASYHATHAADRCGVPTIAVRLARHTMPDMRLAQADDADPDRLVVARVVRSY